MWYSYVWGIQVKASIAVFCAIFCSVFLQAYDFPVPDGPYPVGTIVYHLVDPSREVIGRDGVHEQRELAVQVWYPGQGKKHSIKVPYFRELDPIVKDLIVAYTGCPRFAVNLILPDIYSYAIPLLLPALEPKQFPVIIFSHGFGSTCLLHTSQIEYLASHGYIVVGINHTYDCALTVLSDGRVVEQETSSWHKGKVRYAADEALQVRIDDVRFVLDALAQFKKYDIGKFLSNKFDLKRVGMFGHSLGGATTTQICRLDKRVLAGINMDGPLFGKNAIEGFAKPFMFILADDTWEKSKHGFSVHERILFDIDIEEEAILQVAYGLGIPKLFQALTHDAYCMHIKGADHFSFSDIALLKESSIITQVLFYFYGGYLPGNIAGKRMSTIVNQYVKAFFDHYLLGMSPTILYTPPEGDDIDMFFNRSFRATHS